MLILLEKTKEYNLQIENTEDGKFLLLKKIITKGEWETLGTYDNEIDVFFSANKYCSKPTSDLLVKAIRLLQYPGFLMSNYKTNKTQEQLKNIIFNVFEQKGDLPLFCTLKEYCDIFEDTNKKILEKLKTL